MKTDYEFYGKHLIASYKDCDHKIINDPIAIHRIMTEAIGTTGATILDVSDYTFQTRDQPVIGYTAVFLLSESHASIHTYPEYSCAFVDLFTCGTTCTWDDFHKQMIEGLKSKVHNFQMIERS